MSGATTVVSVAIAAVAVFVLSSVYYAVLTPWKQARLGGRGVIVGARARRG